MVSVKKETMKSVAEYFNRKYKELTVAKEDYEAFLDWTKNPSKNPNKKINEKIMKDMFDCKGRTEEIEYFKRMIRDTELALEIITPLYEVTKEYLD